MNIEVNYAGPYKAGGELFRIILHQSDDQSRLIREFEVWTSYEAIQDKLGISTYPSHKDLAIFGIEIFKQILHDTNDNPPQNGVYVSNRSGIKYYDPNTLPASLDENVDAMVQTNIILPSSLHERTRIEAIKSKISLSELIRISLSEHIADLVLKEKYDDLFMFNEELTSITESMFDKTTNATTKKQLFGVFALGKGYKTHKAVLRLCQQGYGQDAGILVRSLLELAVIAAYLLKDSTNQTIDRYLEHGWIKKKKMFDYATTNTGLAEALKKRAESPREGDLTPEFVAEQAKKAKDIYNFERYDWSDKTISQMAEEVGKDGIYRTVYTLLSGILHSSVEAMNEYLQDDGNGISVDIGQGEKWVQECLVSAFDCFYSIVTNYHQLFELKMDDRLDDLGKRFVEKFENEDQKGGVVN